MANLESTLDQQKIVSRLIDYLDISHERIEWVRSCWKDGQDYSGNRLQGQKDHEFTSTTYFAHLALGEITFRYNIHWDKASSTFSMKFTKWAPVDLKPEPD